MELLQRIGGRLFNGVGLSLIALALIVLALVYISGLSPERREEFLWLAQDYLPIVMFCVLGILLFSGYPVAFILGGIAL
ncbi:MAG: hypothetical protein MI824_05080, partial [Hyphomicrobiales bacterium]|nr:hypothetical protein [Hyphomicrobiales bacterium]